MYNQEQINQANEASVGNLLKLAFGNPTKKPKKKRRAKLGRPAKHEQFPAIIDSTNQFLSANGFAAAQERRRTSAATSCGVTLSNITNHLKENVDGLAEAGISRSTVHRLMTAPRQNTANASRFKGLVKARVPRKSNNSVRKSHPDLHFCRAQCAMMNESLEYFKDDCIRISSDDKNKINVGTLAVSRYHQIRHFFLDDDSPDYLDHDFPYAGSKIVPSGYLVMNTKPATIRQRSRSAERNVMGAASRRTRSQSPTIRSLDEDSNYYSDKLGRMRVNFGRTGPLHVFNRAAMFHSSNAETHANDLFKLLTDVKIRQGKSACMIMTDGGPDWTTKSTKTLIFQGRLWRDLNFDYYALVNLAAGHSRENPIEHLWAPLSKKLVSVTLPITLEGETVPPCEQSDLSEEERKTKYSHIFDDAIDQLNAYWDMSHDNYKVNAIKVPCVENPDSKTYSDYDLIDQFCKSGIKNIQNTPALKCIHNEYMFLLKHCTRRTNLLEFVKCSEMSCSHCTKQPARKTKFMKHLRKCQNRLFTPTPNKDIDGHHYYTWLEMKNRVIHQHEPMIGLDSGCPSVKDKNLLECECKLGCKYVFTSKTDAARHKLVAHHGQRRGTKRKAK